MRPPFLSLLMARWPRVPALAALLLALLAPAARAENVYLMHLGLNGIYSVDTRTGGPATLLTPITAPAGAEGYTLAVRPSDGMLYFLDSNAANPNLWRWNPETPGVLPVLVGTPGASTVGVVRLGFDGAGNLLAMDTATNIWTLDQNTGGILGTMPLNGDKPNSSGDLCLNSATGVLYMVANQSVYTVVADTGVSTLLGTVPGLPAVPNGYVTGCAFTQDGSMLVSLYQGGPLYRLNLNTLAATALPTSTGITQIGDLATAPQRSADLRLSKTASTATPGASVSFTVTVTNDGPNRAADVRVLDLLPAGLTLSSTSASQGTYYATSPATGIAAGTWRAGVLQPGASATLTMNATVTGAALITNTAQISYSDEYDPDSVPGNGAAGEDDQASVTITPSPDLRVTKTSQSGFVAGVDGTYTITVNNVGPAPSSGIYTVTDTLPAGITYRGFAGTGWSCSVAGSTVTCTNSTAIPGNGNSSALTLTVRPVAPVADQVTNTATVAGGGEPGNNNGNNSGSVTTPVCTTTCPDLRMNKTAPASFTVGTVGTYTLSVTNVGGLATGTNPYRVVDNLPAGMTLSAVPAGTNWTCLTTTPGTNTVNGTIVDCTRTTSIAGSGGVSTNLTVQVNVAAGAVPQAENTASVSGGGEPPATQGNNSATVTTPVLDVDLIVSKAKSTAGNFDVGVASAYVFTVRNQGGRNATGTVFFDDTLPPGVTLRTNSGGTGWTLGAGWACPQNTPVAGANTATGSRVYCTRTGLNANTTAATVTVPVDIGPAAAPVANNTVTVGGGGEPAALAGNNSFLLSTPVDAADLAITKSHNGSLAVGTSTDYTLTVTNVGALASSGTITVVDTLPAGLTFVSVTAAGWTCGYAAPTVTCTRGTALAINTSAPPIVVRVTPTAGGTITNTAQVSGGNEGSAYSGNNTATDSTVVYFPPVATKTFTPNSIPSGGTTTLTISIQNPAGSGLASITGLGFSDPFPTGMTVANPPNLVNTCGGTVSPGTSQGDAVLALAGGATGVPGTSCSISVTVTASGTSPKVNTTSEISSANGGTGAPASASLTVTAPVGVAALTKVSSPGVVGVGESAVLTFTINNTTTPTSDMRFRDTLPAGVTTVGTTFGGTCTSTGGTGLSRGVTGGNVINVAGVDLAASASCTVTIPIRAAAAGSYSNTAANISNLLNLSGASVNDTLEVQPVTLTKSFAPAAIIVNTTSTMSLVLTNGAATPEQNGIAFTETLPAGVVLAAAPAASQCGGTVAGTAGGTTVTVSGATLAAGLASCTITATVTSAAAGTYNNVAGNITGLSANLVNSVNATLTVSVPLPTIGKTNNQASITPGDTTDYEITLGNTTAITFTGGTAVVLKDPPVANLTLTGAACAAQGGATCPAAGSAAMVAALQGAAGLTIPSLPPNGTLTFTVQAQLTGNPTGNLVNTATATANGGSISAQDSDAIVYPSLMNTKTVTVLNDPVNGTSNPKSIPGAEALYTITVANTGAGRVDSDTLLIADSIPANTALFVGNLGATPAGPVGFADAGSALSFGFATLASAADDVEFSSDNGGTWSYTPVADANGYDPAVTNIRLRPKGRMAAWSGSGAFPSFSLTFKVKLK